MTKMKERNSQLQAALGAMAPKERVIESHNLPKEDTVNRQGFAAYSIADELRLVSMLNTLKVQPQFYRSENEQMKDLRDLIERIALKDPYFVAQAVVYSRCAGEGMRTVNHLAAALLAPFAAGTEWGKRFYGLYNKIEAKKGNIMGGCIFRADDMMEIKDAYAALNHAPLSNAMRKGFASAIEGLDTYAIAKYKKSIIDIANLSHPDPKKSKATIKSAEGEVVKTLDALMKGITVTADTWEAAQSEAGQEVAAAVKAGKLTKEEGEKVLAEAKADNWESLLKDGRLGILAALRNIRNIMKNPRKETIDMWCKLITNKNLIKQGLILPIHFDLAYDVVVSEFASVDYSPKVQQALLDAYDIALPNIASVFTGKTAVIIDCSGSMGCCGYTNKDRATNGYRRSNRETESCAYKAGLVGATFAKATGADVYKFGSDAHKFTYNKNENTFALARKFGTHDDGWTRPERAFELLRRNKAAYDRIIFISDNETNGRLVSTAYSAYIHDVCSPKIYGIDLASYGTTPLKNDGKVGYFYGYGPSLYEDIVKGEFNPQDHIEKIRKVVI